MVGPMVVPRLTAVAAPSTATRVALRKIVRVVLRVFGGWLFAELRWFEGEWWMVRRDGLVEFVPDVRTLFRIAGLLFSTAGDLGHLVAQGPYAGRPGPVPGLFLLCGAPERPARVRGGGCRV